MNPNTQEIHGSDSRNFETLKYNISNGSNILLDDAYDPEFNFFSKNVKNETWCMFHQRIFIILWKNQ